jgi:hypothetical protein
MTHDAVPAVDDGEGAPEREQAQAERGAGADARVAPVDAAARGRGLRHLDDRHLGGVERAAPLNSAGRRFKREVGAPATEFVSVLEAGQATELVMDAIARSNGTRASVLERLRASEVTDGILGSFRFAPNGDATTASVPILRITGATPPGTDLPRDFQGAVLDRVVMIPSTLVD